MPSIKVCNKDGEKLAKFFASAHRSGSEIAVVIENRRTDLNFNYSIKVDSLPQANAQFEVDVPTGVLALPSGAATPSKLLATRMRELETIRVVVPSLRQYEVTVIVTGGGANPAVYTGDCRLD